MIESLYSEMQRGNWCELLDVNSFARIHICGGRCSTDFRCLGGILLYKFQDASLKWVPMSNRSIRKCKDVLSEFVWIFYPFERRYRVKLVAEGSYLLDRRC